MSSTQISAWFHNWRQRLNQPVKRKPVARLRWGHQAECLESRALLSASTVSPDTVSDIAPIEARAVQFPQVAGTWDVEVAGMGTGTATVTQTRGRVTATIQIPGFEPITVKSRFTRANTHELHDVTHITLPEVGRVKIQTEINFPEVGNPTTFTGSAEITGKKDFELNLVLTGTKQVDTATLAAPNSARAAITFPQVSGFWNITLSQAGGGSVSGVINVSQSGRGGKIVDVSAQDLPAGVSFTSRARFQRSDTNLIKGTAVLKADGETYRARFSVTLDGTNDFAGTATVPKLPTANKTVLVTGTRVEL